MTVKMKNCKICGKNKTKKLICEDCYEQYFEVFDLGDEEIITECIDDLEYISETTIPNILKELENLKEKLSSQENADKKIIEAVNKVSAYRTHQKIFFKKVVDAITDVMDEDLRTSVTKENDYSGINLLLGELAGYTPRYVEINEDERYWCETEEEYHELNRAIKDAEEMGIDDVPGAVLHDILGWC